MRNHLLCWALVIGFPTLVGAGTLPDLPPMPDIPAPLAENSMAMGALSSLPEQKLDLPIQSGPFEPTWQSIEQHYPGTPRWLRDAKFGIWVHFGPQASGESGDWYARRMYIPGTTAYQRHIARYGHPSESGYKEELRDWNPTKLDPVLLTQIYKDAGARFLMIQGVHHDNYDMWNSRYQPWNSVNLGPKRDIIGEWTTACRAEGVRFGVTFHHEYTWWWWQAAFGSDSSGSRAGVPYDGNLTADDGKGKWWEGLDPRRLYGINLREYQGVAAAGSTDWSPPPAGIFSRHLDYAKWFATQWALRMMDVVDQYSPDFIYTDGTDQQPFSGSGTGTGYKSDAMQRVIADFYNTTLDRRGKVDTFSIVKFRSNTNGTVNTEEGGIPADIKTDQAWIAETPVGDWFYAPGFTYDSGMVVRYLLEQVSRDGNVAVCISLLPDGSLDSGSKTMLQRIGQWMRTNGAGIYGSRSWSRYGEGSNTLPGGKLGASQASTTFTTGDFRYTVGADGCLYAYCMTVPSPGTKLHLTALGTSDNTLAARISSVELLGSSADLTWEQTDAELTITCPSSMPFETAVGFKIGSPAIIKTSPPTKLVTSSADGAIAVQWTPAQSGGTFSVRRATSAGGPFTEIAGGLSDSTFIDAAVSADTPYYYVVTATENGNTSSDAGPVAGLVSSSRSWTSRDIGSMALAGSHDESASYQLVRGSGSDIWYASDQFHYVCKPLSGDGMLVARVVAMQNTAPWAKAGLMVRESLDENSKYAIAYVSPSNGTAMQMRGSTGGNAAGIANVAGLGAPYWLKLSRVGSTITAYQSADGVKWTQLGTTTLSLADDVYIGLAVCSVNRSALNHVLFSDVRFTTVDKTSKITWQSPVTVTADSVIDRSGTLVHAGNFRASGSVTLTVGGEQIPFINRATSNAFSDLASGEEAKVVSGAGGKQTEGSLFNAAGTGVSATFESILDGSAWENADVGPAPGATDMDLRVTGPGGARLTEGTIYQIQIFYSDDRAASASRGQRFHDGLGSFSASFLAKDSVSVIGRFVADASGFKDVFAQNTTGESNFPAGFNAYVLRSIGPYDADKDGLPDEWERKWFSNISPNPRDDADGDTSDNETEYRLDLNPTDASSRFFATITNDGVLEWPSVQGVKFMVQSSTTLKTWTDVSTVTGTAGRASFSIPESSGERMFYRVRLEP